MIAISTITVFIVTSLIVIAFLGCGLYWFRLQSEIQQAEVRKQESEHRYASLQKFCADQEQLLIEEQGLRIASEKELAVLDTRYQDIKEQYEQYKSDQKVMEDRFENLANQVLTSKSEQFDEQQRKGLTEILGPLKDRIQTFESKVEVTSKEAIARDAALKEQIRSLSETGDKMSQETINLTKALKGDNKLQGNWGEMVLEGILERSGLEKGREYEVQPTLLNADERSQRPDITIHTPDGKVIIIDSKVSLTAYERLVNTADERGKKYAKDHLRSIKSHIDKLSSKAYHELYEEECPDFVMMFIPIDHALTLALKEDHEIYGYAFDKNIVIVTPGSLVASLKTVESLWKNEKQRQYALDIATEAGSMYDKFVNFCNSMVSIGNGLKQTNSAYDEAMKRLATGNGNLVKKSEQLKAMGAKAKKNLPEAMVNFNRKDVEVA